MSVKKAYWSGYFIPPNDFIAFILSIRQVKEQLRSRGQADSDVHLNEATSLYFMHRVLEEIRMKRTLPAVKLQWKEPGWLRSERKWEMESKKKGRNARLEDFASQVMIPCRWRAYRSKAQVEDDNHPDATAIKGETEKDKRRIEAFVEFTKREWGATLDISRAQWGYVLDLHPDIDP